MGLSKIERIMMHKVLSSRNWLQILILMFINTVFAYKYIQRYSAELAIPLVIGYLVFQFVVFYSYDKFRIRDNNKILLILLPICFAVLHIVSFYFYDATRLNVDRWSIITGFWDRLFAGQYPYYPATEGANPPGPMPLYFVLALPFYLIGEIGYFSLCGFILFYFFIRKYVKEPKYRDLLISFTVISLCVNWDIFTRSTILINATLFLFYFVFLDKIDLNKYKNTFIAAMIGGLLLSTRSIFIVAFIIYQLYLVRNEKIKFGNAILFTLISAVFYLLPISIFPIIYPNDFWIMNPIIVQSEFLIPSPFILLFLLIAAVLGFLTTDKYSLFLNIGLSLFISIFIYFNYHIFKNGFVDGYLNSKADISYFIFSFPFLLYSLSISRSATKNQLKD